FPPGRRAWRARTACAHPDDRDGRRAGAGSTCARWREDRQRKSGADGDRDSLRVDDVHVAEHDCGADAVPEIRQKCREEMTNIVERGWMMWSVTMSDRELTAA